MEVVLEPIDLCPMCARAVIIDRAREEVGAERRPLALCEPCNRRNTVELRKRAGFRRITETWPMVRAELRREGSAEMPVQILLPNGSAIETKVAVREQYEVDRFGEPTGTVALDVRVPHLHVLVNLLDEPQLVIGRRA